MTRIRAACIIAAVCLASTLPSTAHGIGSDDCPTASMMPIASMPFADTGNTCTFNNSYDEHCPTASASSDVVYAYVSPEDQCVDVRLCGATTFNASLYVYASDAGGCPAAGSGDTAQDVACSPGGCSNPMIPQILGLQMATGVQYWFVIDGEEDSCGDYEINILPCPASCTTHNDCCDGIFCNGEELCVQGRCQPGAPPDCDDGNVCTNDSCNPLLDACDNVRITACCLTDDDCDDDNLCTRDTCNRPDTCTVGVCEFMPRQAGTPCGEQHAGVCDAPDTCDADGVCQQNHEQDGTACDDGRICTETDRCSNGICTGQVLEDGASCQDGLFCTVGDMCMSGVCLSGTLRTCDDGNPCTQDTCDEDNSSCVNSVNEECCGVDADCDDGDVCTTDTCGPLNTCVHAFAEAGIPCGDQTVSMCNGANTCDGEGRCAANYSSDGTACNDGDACTVDDACVAGLCIGNRVPECAACNALRDPNDSINRLSLQALLLDGRGKPVQGMVNVTARFYSTDQVQVGEDVFLKDVPVDKGIMSTTVPYPPDSARTARSVGITLNGGKELTPRLSLTSAPKAMQSDCAAGSTITPHLELGSSQASGALRILGPSPPGQTADIAGIPADRVSIYDESSCGGVEEVYDQYGAMLAEIRSCDGPGPYLRIFTATAVADTGKGVVGRLPEETFRISGGGDETLEGALLQMSNWYGDETVTLDADVNDAARLEMYDGTRATVRLEALDNTSHGGAALTLYNSRGVETAEIDADESDAGVIRIKDLDSAGTGNQNAIQLHADKDNEGPEISLWNDAGSKETVEIRGDYQGYGQIKVRNVNGDTAVRIYGGRNDGGVIGLRPGGAASSSLTLYADYDGNGSSRVITDVLHINGGGDLSEQFDIRGEDGTVRPGMLVSIDPTHAGELVVSTTAYDHRVAGVISGAGGVQPGMLMRQQGSIAAGDHPVALTGRVYCWAVTSQGPIEPGDLLTTSDVPGHAMKVTDYDRARGAVIGKAMSVLSKGPGLVLVLVQPL